jgi:hypothetical protein
MATFKSHTYRGGVPFRPIADMPFELTASILVPNGTAIAATDVFKFMKIGANVRVLEVTLTATDLDTATAIVFDVGYSAAVATDDPDAFINDTTIGQTGGIITVANGGDDAFAVGMLAPIAETIDIEAVCTVSPTGNPTTDRYLTVTVKGVGVPNTATAGLEPYVYADRYSSAGVGSL